MSTKKTVHNMLMTALAIFFNPAPLAGDGADAKKEGTRETVPWMVFLPDLNITVQAVDDAGRPIVGYWEDNAAISYAMGLWQLYANDKEALVQAQNNPAVHPPIDSHFKVMVRVITVPQLN